MDPQGILRSATTQARKLTRRPRSRRLTFTYDASGVRLHSRTDRMKAAPPSEPLGASPADDTVVAELRDAQGATIYRARIVGALPSDVELFEPDGTIRRERFVPEKGMFTVVVPADRRADRVVVHAGTRVSTDPIDVSDAERIEDRVVLGSFDIAAPRKGDQQ